MLFCIQAIGLEAMITMNASAASWNDWNDTFKPYVATNLLYDSNFLKLSDKPDPNLDLKNVRSKGEFIKTVNAGIGVNWKVSQQEFVLNADLNYNWFQTFHDFDYFGWNVETRWNWKIGSDLEGSFAYKNIQELAGFDQLNALAENEYNRATYTANAGYFFHPSGRIRLDFFRTENKYQNKSRKTSDLTENNGELNLELISPTKSSLGIRVRATDGDYPIRKFTVDSFLDKGYLRMNYAATYNWVWSYKTRIYGHIGHTNQVYENLKDNNFGDVTALLNISWAATEDVLLTVSTWREIRQTYDLESNFNLSQGVKLSPSWDITPKIKMSTSASYEHQEHQESLATDTNIELRKDQIWSFAYNLIYRPFKKISLNLMLGYENKQSNIKFKGYDSFITGLNIDAGF